ncbi:MAG TPA: hypothetical protein VK178_11070 [Opitutaceae bacterium]|nr:hypothetical protein [Opitutaceae bacterium]
MKKTKTSAGAAAPRATSTKKKTSTAVETPAPVAAAPKPVAAVKRPRPAGPQPTVIQANIDVGFGNTLYVRGEGPGLSWDRGQTLDCLKDDLWSFTIEAAAKPIIFKFLINDETWCTGDDFVVEPGNKITLVPTF